jgi:predicted component of type VI protein secretion system
MASVSPGFFAMHPKIKALTAVVAGVLLIFSCIGVYRSFFTSPNAELASARFELKKVQVEKEQIAKERDELKAVAAKKAKEAQDKAEAKPSVAQQATTEPTPVPSPSATPVPTEVKQTPAPTALPDVAASPAPKVEAVVDTPQARCISRGGEIMLGVCRPK